MAISYPKKPYLSLTKKISRFSGVSY